MYGYYYRQVVPIICRLAITQSVESSVISNKINRNYMSKKNCKKKINLLYEITALY